MSEIDRTVDAVLQCFSSIISEVASLSSAFSCNMAQKVSKKEQKRSEMEQTVSKQ
jgi:hypothetical protein